ncbi:TPA: hypothetical protein U2Q01_000641 [Burkholderia multivorans]|uniref:hypothetical protein n=1 Tax=Burkholderia multivorans TaxID=87883 RepID=UPI001B90F199|nr:hypothetical protein [Burkholderia multivorans]MBR7899228.1 hypothetical protein [Burkholderia multivorans]MBU9221311.1 hypothetical protein [Burkholderia multivorans]HEM8494226.1 hypothetical protein [Burkholderia multivorans]
MKNLSEVFAPIRTQFPLASILDSFFILFMRPVLITAPLKMIDVFVFNTEPAQIFHDQRQGAGCGRGRGARNEDKRIAQRADPVQGIDILEAVRLQFDRAVGVQTGWLNPRGQLGQLRDGVFLDSDQNEVAIVEVVQAA